MTRELHTLSPDAILEALEERQETYILAADAEARAEVAHEALFSSTYRAYREASTSQEDAKQAVKRSDKYIESAYDLICKHTEAARAKAAVERAKLASELYRTVRADQRRV